MSEAKIFEGSKEECKAFLSEYSGYYVYILRRPDGRPFYVGKGIGDRVFNHEVEARHPNDRKSNSYKLNVIRSLWRQGSSVVYEIAYQGDDEQDAYDEEARLISQIRRLHEGGPLTNLAPGGGNSTGISPISKRKHAATLGGIPENNPERAIVNRYLLSVGVMDSIAIKPISQLTVKPSLILPKKKGGPTLRQAAVLVASAAINGKSLDGACQIPRKLIVDDVPAIIENGVSCRILLTEMASIIAAENPVDEIFALNAQQSRVVVNIVGVKKCFDLGVISSF
ncbi:GIY-YIG nuclease family protein [Ruegeria sp. HKCCD7221]|uniref:GIY-YIG nuclease family protein n=1 Tax=Ruegeria sp. HKCCD7221 TaxID=2683009 RepID=UPI00147D21A5|nr:GIY-YIG nuclease family protein [Ruegeria sp. HKCCD7221]